MTRFLKIKINNFCALLLIFFILICFLLNHLSASAQTLEINQQNILADLAIIILQEPIFQDAYRTKNYKLATEILENEYQKRITNFQKYFVKQNNLQQKITDIILALKNSIIEKNDRAIENNYNKFLEYLYNYYDNFQINEAPEINFFYIDIIQCENYLTSKNWRLLKLETNEMLSFYDIVKSKFETQKKDTPENLFLMKYLKLNLKSLESAAFDNDSKTIKRILSELKNLIAQFNYKLYKTPSK